MANNFQVENQLMKKVPETELFSKCLVLFVYLINSWSSKFEDSFRFFVRKLKHCCSSSFLICIVFCLINVIHSQEHPSTAVLKTLKMHSKICCLGLLCDFSPENIIRTEVAKYIILVSLNWKFFLLRITKFTRLCEFLVNEILAPIHVLFK